jgi:hypothetical protein
MQVLTEDETIARYEKTLLTCIYPSPFLFSSSSDLVDDIFYRKNGFISYTQLAMYLFAL